MLGFRAWTVKIPTNTRRVTRVYRQGENLSTNPEPVSQESFEYLDKISLGAIAHNKSWPKNFMQAECQTANKSMLHDKVFKIDAEGHDVFNGYEQAPAKLCGCGIYAFYDWDFAIQELMGHAVIGVVQGWGKIQLHETGFRSEFMSIIGFIDHLTEYGNHYHQSVTHNAALIALSKRYKAPIMGVKEAKALQQEFASVWKDRIFNVENLEDFKDVQ